jgi:hypothetical protein
MIGEKEAAFGEQSARIALLSLSWAWWVIGC